MAEKKQPKTPIEKIQDEAKRKQNKFYRDTLHERKKAISEAARKMKTMETAVERITKKSFAYKEAERQFKRLGKSVATSLEKYEKELAVIKNEMEKLKKKGK